MAAMVGLAVDVIGSTMVAFGDQFTVTADWKNNAVFLYHCYLPESVMLFRDRGRKQ
jgi:hypothetical protein